MTTFTQTPSEDDVFKAIRFFLQDILPPENDTTKFVVVVGQENKVSEPKEDNYIVMWPLRMPRLSTNFVSHDGVAQEQSTRQAAQVTIQLDVHGAQAFNNSMRISTLFRDGYAVGFFEQFPEIAPLYADDPRNAQFVSGEDQYEDRYVIEANLQVNFTLTATAESARTLTVGLIDVETNPDHWPNSIASATGP